jgi:sigma-B regulation protein RsbU (phosphoserine phosphatase)
MKILIAEDDAIPRRLLEATLARWDYEVVAAHDGDEAWEILQQAEDAPRLAILDWQMPGMDGVEVCRRVRERPEDAPYVYLLLLTGKDSKEDLIAGLEAGADDYLTKPFNRDELQVRLRAGRRILELEGALRRSLDEVRRAEAELARARERESDTGGRIQKQLLLGRLPHAPEGLRIAPLTLPSQRVDGDFYDFFLHSPTCLDVIVGDVMGKGVAAALLGAAIKSHFLRALGQLMAGMEPGRLPEPEQIVSLVHAEVTAEFIGLERFATLVYARFDLLARRVIYVDCGHTKTIQYRRRADRCDLLEGESMPLGFSERETYRQEAASFGEGDVFFFYSDGVTEAQDETGELFGVDRLVELVRARHELAPDALIEAVRQAVIAYSHSETFADDLTCVAIRAENLPPAPAASAPPAVSLEVASGLTELPALRAFVRRFCEEECVPPLHEEGIWQLELAVTEAASNIVRHAYGGRTDGVIRIEVETTPESGVSVRLYHRGETFDPEAVRPPVFDGSREGGFGVYFIAESVDLVRYERGEDGSNCVLLVKNRRNGDEEEDGDTGREGR